MSTYGWQVFDENGSLLYDDSVIMSRMLGSYSIPWITSYSLPSSIDTVIWAHTISNIAFSEGTPYVFWLPTAGTTVPSARSFSFIPPDVLIGSNYLTLRYTARMMGFVDDQSDDNCAGGVTIYWGVYNA